MQFEETRLFFGSTLAVVVIAIAILNFSGFSSQTAIAVEANSATPTPQLFFPVIQNDSILATHPSTDGHASWSSPIAVSGIDNVIWVANPDSGTITAIDGETLTKTAEISVGEEPWNLAVSPDGRHVYVTDRVSGALSVVETTTKQVINRIPIGGEVNGLALGPSGATAYIVASSDAEVVVMDLQSLTIQERIAVDPHPYAIAITDDGDAVDNDERLFVTHFQAFLRPGGVEATDDGRIGRVTVLDAATTSIADQITLAPDTHGFPNLLAGIAIHQNRAWVAHLRAAPDLPSGLTTTVFAAVAVLDLEDSIENPDERLLLNDQDIFGSPVNNPMAAIPSPDGTRLYLVLAGSDLLEVVNVSDPNRPELNRFLPTGKNPRGMALSPDGRRGYVMNYLSRSVTVLDLDALVVLAEIPVTEETLAPDLWQGKVLFNNATNPKLSRGSWISCASCHPDGGTDGVTWMFPDGPRQTPPLWNSGQTLPWHWSAALDEAQDIEETIQVIQHGLGLAPGVDPSQLGPPNTGRSQDLDALATFVTQGIRTPNAPAPLGNGPAGRALFQSAGCAACHGGAFWTSSVITGTAGALDADNNGMVDAVLHQVSTFNDRDIRGETGFDSPSLLNVGLTAPYFHDGSMPTLNALLASGHPDPQGAGNGLRHEEILLLVSFLRSIGPETPSVNPSP